MTKQCSRCLKMFEEHVGLHECIPTPEWYELEQQLIDRNAHIMILEEKLQAKEALLMGCLLIQKGE